MTLHEAIQQLLRQLGHPMTTREIADHLNANRWYVKKDGSEITAFQIHGRTKNYPQFKRDGSVVSLVEWEIKHNHNSDTAKPTRTNTTKVSSKNADMKHGVKFSIPERELGNADIEFQIRKSGKKFGTLKVSKGSVVWVQKDNTYGYKMNWHKLDELMKKEGKHEKGR